MMEGAARAGRASRRRGWFGRNRGLGHNWPRPPQGGFWPGLQFGPVVVLYEQVLGRLNSFWVLCWIGLLMHLRLGCKWAVFMDGLVWFGLPEEIV